MLVGLIRAAGIVALVLTVAGLVPSALAQQTAPPTFNIRPDSQRGLVQLVETYLRSNKREQRKTIVSSIDKEAAGDVRRVIDALQEVNVWESLGNVSGRIYFPGSGRPRVVAEFMVPDTYDPAIAHPMLVFMAPEGASAAMAVMSAANLFGELARGHVILGIDPSVSSSFAGAASTAGELGTLMRLVRKRIHIDTDRVYILGVGDGADRAWMAALGQPDLFAGLIVASGFPRVPYAKQFYPMLLPNLLDMPVMLTWSAPATAGWQRSAEMTPRSLAVSEHCRAIAALASQLDLPITAIEQASDVSPDRLFSSLDLSTALARRRAAYGRRITRWFRYPAHGNAGWVRQTRFRGDVWNDPELSILASPSVDRDWFITDILQGKMGYIAAEITGQVIELQTRRCVRIDLQLSGGLFDWQQPVTIRCNGRKRHDKRLEPSIKTLLESARAEWEFQRPVVVRLSLSIRTDAR